MTGLKPEDIWETYEGDNYQCVDTGIESDICYIFFSSNGLYYPDEKEVFDREIIYKDRYEWKWMVFRSDIPKKAGRIIYVRDVFKDWYSRGISSKVDTIEKTIDLLRELTQGYRVISVGSSAGGYMAVLSAIKLQALWCINFSGQYKVNTAVSEAYQDLSGMLKDYHGQVFYFVPVRSKQDLEQYEYVKDISCIRSFTFNGKKHADTMLAGNMPYVIDRNKEEMLALYKKYNGKRIGKVGFLLQTVPISGILRIMPKEIKGFIQRRYRKYFKGSSND